MLDPKDISAGFAFSRDKWEKLIHQRPRAMGDSGRLEQHSAFGSNPGNLRMFAYLPPELKANSALVVVLHGCTQTASGYDIGAGWSTLADRYGFAVLYPEQQRSNNANGCFNWFQPEDIQRDRGEAQSIRQMVETLAVEKGIDRSRIFVTGLSAGGAMTSVLLACYPEVFAGGAIIAGLPFGCAANMQEAFASMFQSPARPARQWGDLVRNASAHDGRWPRISVWHGSTDTTVVPSNAQEILKQWSDVHGLPATPSATAIVDGYPRQVWFDSKGNEVIESYTIHQMAHGTPLAIGDAHDNCGAAGPFLLDVGISSSYHICRFFGLAPSKPVDGIVADERAAIGGEIIVRDPAPQYANAEREQHDHTLGIAKKAGASFRRIESVIEKALRGAGLMK